METIAPNKAEPRQSAPPYAGDAEEFLFDAQVAGHLAAPAFRTSARWIHNRVAGM